MKTSLRPAFIADLNLTYSGSICSRTFMESACPN